MDETTLKKIKLLIKKVPESPGVYKMLDTEKKVIYVGKAKNLRNRVGQYFQLAKAQSAKVKKMIECVDDVSYIETDTEFEALILETNLIKEYRPKYNILMKDDKNYVYIKITVNEDYPRILMVRQREKDGSIYFGPKTSAHSVEKMMNVLRKIFPTRTCNLEMTWKSSPEIKVINQNESNGNKPRGEVIIKNLNIPIPCLEYHIKRCNAPCVNKESRENYNKTIQKIIHFLKGDFQELITRLKYEMFSAAKDKKFEEAGLIRDKIKSVEDTFLIQKVSEPEFIDRDVVGLEVDFGKAYINLFQFREGKLIGQENFALSFPDTSQESPLENYLKQYYSESTDIPTEILVRDLPAEAELLEIWLTENYKKITGNEESRKKVKLITAQKGAKEKILRLSEKNAKSFAKQSQAKWISDTSKTVKAASDLADELGMNGELKRIECYDISHIGGEDTTASMVVFKNGSPENKEYRHFKLRELTQGEIDDYKSMKEVLTRRLSRLSPGATENADKYKFKKPKKEDQEILIDKILSKLSSRKIDINWKDSIAVYDEKSIVAFGRIAWSPDGNNAEIKDLLVEPDHYSDSLAHSIISKLIEKTKLKHIYTVTNAREQELWEKYGFQQLKKIPDFLMKQYNENLDEKTYMICKIKPKPEKEDSSFSRIPDLIIVDGGKGQLSVAAEVMDQMNLNIQVIGLAKQEEEIFMINKQSDDKNRFTRIVLAKNTEALYLVQRIRDEAHRFANELRKKLGTKKLTASEIDDIPGIGLIIKRKLLKEYGSIKRIKETPFEELEKCVGTYIAKMLKEKL